MAGSLEDRPVCMSRAQFDCAWIKWGGVLAVCSRARGRRVAGRLAFSESEILRAGLRISALIAAGR